MMKRFTTLLVSLLFVFAAFAQNVVVEELWNDSKMSNGAVDPILGDWIDGDAPSWMGGTTERGMTQIDDKIYIPSRNGGNYIFVLDALTGSQLGTMEMPADPVSGGTFAINSIAKTASGDLLLANLATNTQAVEDPAADPIVPTGHFKVYQIELDAAGTGFANITTVISWHNYGDTEYPSFRIGDGFSFFGDVAVGADGYVIVAAASSNYVLRWDVTDAVFDAAPTIFQLADSNPAPAEGAAVNLGSAPQCFPVSNELVIIDGKDLFPSVYDMTGQMIATFSGETKPIQPSGNGVAYFMFEGRSFVVANSTIWSLYPEGAPENSFQLFELINDSFELADSISMLPAEGLSSSGVSNASFTYPVAVDVLPNEVMIYVMAPNSGIAGFKMTIDSGTSIEENEADAITIYPNPASDVVNFSEKMASVKVYEMSGKLVREVTNTTQVNVSDLRGLYLINAVDAKGNVVRKTVMVQ